MLESVSKTGGHLGSNLGTVELTVALHYVFNTPEESYEFAAKRKTWETVPPLLDRASPLRTSHLRDPGGPQVHFAVESFMDELAYSLGADPVEFRLKYVKDARDIAVIKAATEKAGWAKRTGARRQSQGDVLIGQGFSYASRAGTRVAMVAEVEVHKVSGRVWVKKWTVAHDCGQIINPDGLEKCIEGNIVQGISRTLWEEVKFDNKNVTSVDWMTYPILDIGDVPEKIDFVLINHPELPPSGAGEPSIRPIAAAIANAIYNAIGVRMHDLPMTRERVLAALQGVKA